VQLQEEEDLEPVLIPHIESAEWKEVEKLLSLKRLSGSTKPWWCR